MLLFTTDRVETAAACTRQNKAWIYHRNMSTTVFLYSNFYKFRFRVRNVYKSSAPRGVDTARCVRAIYYNETLQLKKTNGEEKRPVIWCSQRFDNPKNYLCRADCPELMCACWRGHALIGSTGVIREKKQNREGAIK